MATRHMLFDKTEIIFAIIGKNKVTTTNVTYDRITKISFESFIEKKLFSKKPSERIVIRVSGMGAPLVYNKSNEKKFFEEYKQELRVFAKENRLTIFDTTNEEQND